MLGPFFIQLVSVFERDNLIRRSNKIGFYPIVWIFSNYTVIFHHERCEVRHYRY